MATLGYRQQVNIASEFIANEKTAAGAGAS
jgi:hypothetical protein